MPTHCGEICKYNADRCCVNDSCNYVISNTLDTRTELRRSFLGFTEDGLPIHFRARSSNSCSELFVPFNSH